jgi:predicted MFS family arabinose efflux permease
MLALTCVTFLSGVGARIVDPLLSVIAAGFGATIADVSGVVAGFTLSYSLNQLVVGPLGDRYGKPRILLMSVGGYAVTMAACSLAPNLPSLILLRALAGAAAGGMIPTTVAYIGDWVPYEKRQLLLSRVLNGVILAQILAGPLGGVFGQWISWRAIFLVLAGLALAVTAYLRHQFSQLPTRSAPSSSRIPDYRVLAGPTSARLLLIGAMLEGALCTGVFPFLAPYLRYAFGISYFAAGAILALFGVGALASTQFTRRLIGRLSEARLVLLGGSLMAAGFALAGVSAGWPPVLAVELLLGFGYITLHRVLQTRATELLPHARATAVSTFAFMLFLGQSVGAVLIGALIAHAGYQQAFLFDAVGVALLSVGLGRLCRNRRRQ